MTPLHLKFVENAFKHGITKKEIWEIFLNTHLPPVIVNYKKSKNDKIYNALGVSDSGRYLVIGFVREKRYTFRVIHAKDMREHERKRFKKTRKIK